jgi:hypothetical protein
MATTSADDIAAQLREAGASRVGVNRHTTAGRNILDRSTAAIQRLTPEAVNAGLTKRAIAELVGVSATQLFNILNATVTLPEAAGADVELQRQRHARKLAAEVRRLARETREVDQAVSKLLEQAARKLAV